MRRGQRSVAVAWLLFATTVAAMSISNGAALAEPVEILPGTDIQSVVDTLPAGTELLLRTGVHRMQQVVPKDDQVFAGEPGTILNGSKVLTGWIPDGGRWYVTGQTQEFPAQDPDNCDDGFERCARREELFVDDVTLRHVTSLGAVGPGSWFFDYGADRIYVGEDPTGKVVETGVTPSAFSGSADGVVIRDLVVEKYANPAQEGAIDSRGSGGDGLNWVIDGVEARLNHGSGIHIVSGGVIRNSHVHHNGQQGFSANGTGIVVEDSEISFNNTARFGLDWEGGGNKLIGTDLTIRRNFSHDNYGPGIWIDINSFNVVIEDNVVEDNFRAGIFFEVSNTAFIRGNYTEGNGLDDPRAADWLWASGILVASSLNAEVHDNVVVNNGNGITATQQPRGSGPWGLRRVENLDVHDNWITMGPDITPPNTLSRTGAVQDVGDDAIFTSRNNTFQNNTYYGTGGRFAWFNATRTFPEWQGFGLDTTGSISDITTTPPTWSSSLTATATTDTTVTLTWAGASDPDGIGAYRIYEDTLGLVATTAGATTTTVRFLQPDTPYNFTVEAVDVMGNESTDGPSFDHRVRFPLFAVDALHDRVTGVDWLPNRVISITVNGSEVFSADSDSEGDFETDVSFDITPGDIVEVEDSADVKLHLVYDLQVSGVDDVGDRVVGIGPAGTTVGVVVDGWNEIAVVAGDDDSDGVPGDGLGVWLADFSGVFDIVDETRGHAYVGETAPEVEDGDRTFATWWVANPRIQVNITENQVRGGDWPEDVSVDLSIDGKPQCDDSQIAGVSLDRSALNVFFDMTGCAVVPGDVVTLSDGVTTEVHEVRDIQVTNGDTDLDTIEGTNDIPSRVFVLVWGDGTQERASRNNLNALSGPWLADFATPPASENEGVGVFDIQSDSSGIAGAAEPNENETIVDWVAEPLPASGMLRVVTVPAVESLILVDGVPMDRWGLNWVRVPVGDHEVSFSDVQGRSTPPPQTVTVFEDTTTAVTGDFLERGWLRVITNPAVAGTIYVDGIPMDDWGVWTDLEPGSYEVCFGDVPDFATPACQTADVVAGANTLIEGVYTSSPGTPGATGFGYLRVITNPPVGVQILVDGIPRETWGLDWVKFDPGTYEVSFTDIIGYTTPDPATITVVEGETTVVQGDYIQRGWLRIITDPAVAGTIFINGLARNDWGMWNDLDSGTYEVCFGNVPGFETPACSTEEVSPDQTTIYTGNYVLNP